MPVRRVLILLLLATEVFFRKTNLFGVGTYISRGRIWVTVNFEQTAPGWP